MKIVMDFRKYYGVIGGVEQGAIQVTKYVCGEGHEVVLLCKEKNLAQVKELFGEPAGLKIVPLPVESHVMSLANARLDTGLIQDLAVQEGADLIHFYYNWSFPFRKKVPCLLTVHDVIPFTFREAMGFLRNRFVYRPCMRTACRLNDLITCVSEFSRQDLSKVVGVPLDKIRVIPNGLRTPAEPSREKREELNRKFGIEKGYVLNVGGIHERKNIPRLVQAFAKVVRDESYEGKLVITGSTSGAPYQEKMKKVCDAAVAEAGMQDRVVFTGFVSEDDLDLLLRDADVFVYPSLYEGFGIPILEAMKVETPVVTSNVTAMPEVAAGAALMADPLNVDEMAAAVARLLEDEGLRARLVEEGLKRAEPYSWKSTCEQYASLYAEMAARG